MMKHYIKFYDFWTEQNIPITIIIESKNYKFVMLTYVHKFNKCTLYGTMGN